jgi:hypothetical protein
VEPTQQNDRTTDSKVQTQHYVYTIPHFSAARIISQFRERRMGNACSNANTASTKLNKSSKVLEEVHDLLNVFDEIRDSRMFYRTTMCLLAQLDDTVGDLPDKFQEDICLKMDQILKLKTQARN